MIARTIAPLAAKLLVFAGLLVGALVRHDVFFYVMLVVSALAVLLTDDRTSAPPVVPDHVATTAMSETFTRPDWTAEADR